jgi:ABC-type glycerol-3-phosphate transport system substrate-binding protein
VLTDWFENVLAAVDPLVYEQLARDRASWNHRRVGEVLDLLAELWSIPGAFPGGGRRALLTQFEESVMQVVTRRAVMVFEADFVAGAATKFLQPDGEQLAWFRFPAVAGTAPLVLGGDAAVVLRSAGAGLVEWLTRPEAFASWAASGGYLSPLPDTPGSAYPDSRTRQFAEDLEDGADELRFDLSDRLPGAFTGADGVGIWRILQDFFAAVTTPGSSPAAAIVRTTAELEEARLAAGRDHRGGL